MQQQVARGRTIRASRPSRCAPNRADSSCAQAGYGSSRTKASRRRDGRPDPTLADVEGDEGKRVSGREREEEERDERKIERKKKINKNK